MDILRAINRPIPDSIFFDELVSMYNTPVYNLCLNLTYSKEDADDLFQETFLRAFERMDKIKDWDNPRAFLISCTLYLWKSWKRRYARRNRIAPTSPLDEAIRSRENIEDEVIAREETRLVREMVSNLPEKFKIPIVMHYAVEMNVAEIAKAMKLPEGTVKSRLFKARKLIEKGLDEDEKRR